MTTNELLKYVENPGKIYITQIGTTKIVPVKIKVKTGEASYRWMYNTQIAFYVNCLGLKLSKV